MPVSSGSISFGSGAGECCCKTSSAEGLFRCKNGCCETWAVSKSSIVVPAAVVKKVVVPALVNVGARFSFDASLLFLSPPLVSALVVVYLSFDGLSPITPESSPPCSVAFSSGLLLLRPESRGPRRPFPGSTAKEKIGDMKGKASLVLLRGTSRIASALLSFHSCFNV